MKRKIDILSLCFAMTMVLASCLSNEEEETVKYNDTAISSFTLGTLKRTVHTTSSTGTDSTYTTTFDASKYKFYIDHQSGEIYNADSLPVGVHANKVVCSINTVNSGYVLIKSMSSDSLKFFSSTDSIDFTSPRELRVFPNSGVDQYRKYVVKLNVHQQVPDTFMWNKRVRAEVLTAFSTLRAQALTPYIYIVGGTGNGAQLLRAAQSSPGQWTVLNNSLTANAVDNFVGDGSKAYLLDAQKLYVLAADGTLTHYAVSNIARLAGVANQEVYAFNTAGQLVVGTAPFTQWTVAQLDDETSWLPASNAWLFTFDASTNNEVKRRVLVGNTNNANYAYATVWQQTVDTQQATQALWNRYVVNANNPMNLPAMENLQVVNYGQTLLAIGGKGKGTATVQPYSRVYESGDYGLTWQKHATCYLPADFTVTGNAAAIAVDSQNRLWLFAGGTGWVWNGQLTQLGWSNTPRAFTE